MNNIIQCQVKQIEPVNNYGKIKVHLLPLEENESIKSSNGFKQDSNTFSINWKEQEAIPDWLVEGNQIKMPFKIYMDYAIYDQFSKIGVQVLGESNPVADIKKAFPDATLEELPDSLDEEETDFAFGNNVEKKLNGHSADPVQAKINNYADLYAKIFATIHKHEYLAKLDTGLKKDIATSFFIQLNR
tara:strand:+ start:676 stop:1236 length:561 start_codon:yes stop_codon:yes gene_type:complete